MTDQEKEEALARLLAEMPPATQPSGWVPSADDKVTPHGLYR